MRLLALPAAAQEKRPVRKPAAKSAEHPAHSKPTPQQIRRFDQLEKKEELEKKEHEKNKN